MNFWFGIWRFVKWLLWLGVPICFGFWLLSLPWQFVPKPIQYGFTFSIKEARDLGLDWQQVLTSALSDLKPKTIRLSAYWDQIEPEPGNYQWQDLDWQIAEAAKYKTQVILAVGSRLPRWPECHLPKWATTKTENQRQDQVLQYIRQVVKKYQLNSIIVAWQVENEPFLSNFGECPEFSAKFLDEEIQVVRELDTRPIVVTDSGELSTWVLAAKRADIFGTTMYRDTYSNVLKSYVHYPIKPGFFRVKKRLSDIIAHPKKWIVIELQGEPWAPKPFQQVSQAERDKTMSLAKFTEMNEFARATGFDELYWWGVEWWYWERQQGRPEFWEKAANIFNNQ